MKHKRRKREFLFRTWTLDKGLYSLSLEITIRPGYWTEIFLCLGRWTLKWEWTRMVVPKSALETEEDDEQ